MQSSFTSPINYAVYQRDNANKATVQLAGFAGYGCQSVELNVYEVGQSLALQTIKTTVDSSGMFSVQVTLRGGWYRVQGVTDLNDQLSIPRFGVGEVFVLFGHSFLQGGSDKTYYRPATDERSCTLLDRHETLGRYQYGPIREIVGPSNGESECWGLLADKLVESFGVPVLIYSAAFGGSNIEQSYKVLKGIPFQGGFVNYEKRHPIAFVENVFKYYTPVTGIRAVLVEHGYNDRASTTAVFTDQFRFVLDYIRSLNNTPNLGYFIVQEEFTEIADRLTAPTTAPGIQLILQTYPNVFPGPNFNDSIWLPAQLRGASKHLQGEGITLFGNEWARTVKANYLRCVPYPGQLPVTDSTTDDVNFYAAPMPQNGVWMSAALLLLIIVYLRQND